MNTIIINEKDMAEIMDYEGSHYFENFIFNDFRLIERHGFYKVVYKIHIDGNVNEVNYRMIKGDEFKDCRFTFAETEKGIDIIEFPNGELVDIETMTLVAAGKAKTKEEIETVITDLFAHTIVLISRLKQYIMNKSYERITVLKESCGGATPSKGGKKSNARKANVQYLLKEIVEYVSHSGRKHDIHCECWTVRGHFRHYKTGNVVWISAYEKGKKRNTNQVVSGKVYMV